MNTTRNTRTIIATAILAATAGFALASCAGQRPPPVSEQSVSEAQLAEKRSAYRDLVERRQELERDRSSVPTAQYRDQSERRADIQPAVGGEALYRDQAERRAGLDGSVGVSTYRDLADRRLSIHRGR